MTRQLEHLEQCAVVSWFKLQYPAYAGCLVAIPNGAHLAGTPKQRAQKMAKMKREGLKTGASDLFIALPRGGFSGLWIEMKATGKTACSVSSDQRDHLDLMAEVGYSSHWCAGRDSAIETIKQYMKSSGLCREDGQSAINR